MLKFISAWLGLCCTLIGTLFIFLRDEMPGEITILTIPESMLLTLFGVFLMYMGREYLPGLLGDFFGRDGGSD